MVTPFPNSRPAARRRAATDSTRVSESPISGAGARRRVNVVHDLDAPSGKGAAPLAPAVPRGLVAQAFAEQRAQQASETSLHVAWKGRDRGRRAHDGGDQLVAN